MKILIVATSLSPEYGGPARSVSGLALALADSGIRVGLWAADGSSATTPFLPAISSVNRLDGDIETAVSTFAPDIVHDNGIWLPHNHRVARIAIRKNLPRIVSTRGMLEPWAMKHRQWKKRFAWVLYQRRDLTSASLHHATACSEAENISRLNLSVPVTIIPNGIEVPPAMDTSTKRRLLSPRTALFVGRIHPVKGLSMLIEAWSIVRPSGWRMRIVGPDEDRHRTNLINRIRQFALEDDFEFTGPLEGQAKHAVFSDASLFILPSHSENFGMAIGEALAHGLPVLTTRGAPWSLIETERCGWWTPINSAGIATALAEATTLPVEKLIEMGNRGRRVVAERFAWSAIARNFINVYDEVLKSPAHGLIHSHPR